MEKKQRRIVTAHNWKPSDHRLKDDFDVSRTVPDSTYTIAELLRRQAQGKLLPNIGKSPVFNGDMDILGGRQWDMMEINDQMDVIDMLRTERDKRLQKEQETQLLERQEKERQRDAKIAENAIRDYEARKKSPTGDPVGESNNNP